MTAGRANPLLSWIEEDPKRGPVAAEIYTSTLNSLNAIPADYPDPVAAAEPILRDMILRLNDLDDAEVLFMDTIRRDDAGDVFADLAQMARVPSDVADRWFDQWREF